MAIGEKPASTVQDIADQPGTKQEVMAGGRSDFRDEEFLKPTPDEQRDEFYSTNPVMLDMRARQAELGLGPDEVPPYESAGPLLTGAQREHPQLQATLENDYSGGTGWNNLFGDNVDMQYETYQANQRAAKAKYDPSEFVGLSGAGQKAGNKQAARGPGTKGLDMLNRGYDKQRSGLKERHAAESSRMETIENNAAIEAARTDEVNREYLDKYNNLQKERDDLLKKAQVLQQKFADGSIDPNRFWANMDTGRKTKLAVAAFLQGFGGGPNQMAFLRQAIDNDIKAQIENRKAMGDNAKNMFTLAEKIFGNGKEALDITRAMALESVKLHAKALLAKADTNVKKAGLQELIGKLDVEQGKYLDQAALERYKAQATRSKEDKTIERLNKEFNWRVANLGDNITKLDGLVKEWGTFEATGPQSHMMSQLMYDIAIDYAKVVDPNSVAREGEVEAARKYMLPIGKWMGLGMKNSTAREILKQYRNVIQTKVKNRAQAYETYQALPRGVYQQNFTPSK